MRSQNQFKPEDIWKDILSLVNIKSTKLSGIKILNKSKNLASDPRIIPNMFNDQFPTIVSKIRFQPGTHDYFNKKKRMVKYIKIQLVHPSFPDCSWGS